MILNKILSWNKVSVLGILFVLFNTTSCIVLALQHQSGFAKSILDNRTYQNAEP